MESRSWKLTWKAGQKLRELNDRLMMAERAFTDRDGLPGRSWYKHLVSIALSAFHEYKLFLKQSNTKIETRDKTILRSEYNDNLCRFVRVVCAVICIM